MKIWQQFTYKDLLHNRRRKFWTVPHLLSQPLIWAPLPFLLMFDLTFEIYHQLGFRLYGLNRVNRSEYVLIDRGRLSKLTLFEKIGCICCGYVNGYIPYAREIAARTEAYWCGIIHENKAETIKHQPHEKNFHSRKSYE